MKSIEGSVLLYSFFLEEYTIVFFFSPFCNLWRCASHIDTTQYPLQWMTMLLLVMMMMMMQIPKDMDRIVGAHFFSPAHIMPLLEIVRTSKTSPQVVLDILNFGSVIKKTPVVVGNCTGFAVNRVFFPYTQAACLLVDLGADPYKIDKAVAGEKGGESE